MSEKYICDTLTPYNQQSFGTCWFASTVQALFFSAPIRKQLAPYIEKILAHITERLEQGDVDNLHLDINLVKLFLDFYIKSPPSYDACLNILLAISAWNKKGCRGACQPFLPFASIEAELNKNIKNPNLQLYVNSVTRTQIKRESIEKGGHPEQLIFPLLYVLGMNTAIHIFVDTRDKSPLTQDDYNIVLETIKSFLYNNGRYNYSVGMIIVTSIVNQDVDVNQAFNTSLKQFSLASGILAFADSSDDSNHHAVAGVKCGNRYMLLNTWGNLEDKQQVQWGTSSVHNVVLNTKFRSARGKSPETFIYLAEPTEETPFVDEYYMTTKFVPLLNRYYQIRQTPTSEHSAVVPNVRNVYSENEKQAQDEFNAFLNGGRRFRPTRDHNARYHQRYSSNNTSEVGGGIFDSFFSKSKPEPKSASKSITVPKSNPAIKIKKNASYKIHDNGGRPFQVDVTPTHFTVKKQLVHSVITGAPYDKIVVPKTQYVSIFIGRSPEHGKKYDGNTILVQLAKNQYMYIGPEIFTFTVEDEIIVGFMSPLYGSDVSYPYAVGTKNTYLLLEHTFIPNSMTSSYDPYIQFYGMKKKMKQHVQKHQLTRKIIHKRM